MTQLPEEWRQARHDPYLEANYGLANHPFHRRFSIFSRLIDDAIDRLVQFMRLFGTAQCYTLEDRTRKRREFLEDPNATWHLTAAHRTRLMSIARETSEPFYYLIRLDQEMRRMRSYGNITTPRGHSFIYLMPSERWLDVSL